MNERDPMSLDDQVGLERRYHDGRPVEGTRPSPTTERKRGGRSGLHPPADWIDRKRRLVVDVELSARQADVARSLLNSITKSNPLIGAARHAAGQLVKEALDEQAARQVEEKAHG